MDSLEPAPLFPRYLAQVVLFNRRAPRPRFRVRERDLAKKNKPKNRTMLGRWTNWKPFPNRGENIEAPIGPGVYEVCHASTGEQVAFGSTDNVAQALSNVLPKPGRTWPFFRRAARPRYVASELEYRTCAAGTLAEARVAVGQMLSQRQALLRRFSPGAKH